VATSDLIDKVHSMKHDDKDARFPCSIPDHRDKGGLSISRATLSIGNLIQRE
jgi:hypothetical protein